MNPCKDEHTFVNIHIDTSIDMHIDMCVDRCVAMRVNMCADMCSGIRDSHLLGVLNLIVNSDQLLYASVRGRVRACGRAGVRAGGQA